MKTTRLYQQLLVCFGIAVFFFACQNESRDNASTAQQPDSLAPDAAETTETAAPSLPYAAVFDETSEQLRAQKNPDFDGGSLLTIDRITQLLANAYPQVVLTVDSTVNDTLHVQITDASFLTQQMGSSGAAMYLLEATYAYTELPGIQAVHFVFEEGDHAIPGTYTREHFETNSTPR
ncbi:hypothetical protein SAMN05421747_10254 [Parapedobacter composti]|uniref:Sporulation and spore germination n=1 Tax=Parapedobacter composti TaxID=623281 RepID=A0A1I1EVJ8_9SPHI|nr:hypothetical protein [Parapedobacter composti]SFB91165.1 hypothetical protein SAMN05421747_10254 [Parapedobacter composti]